MSEETLHVRHEPPICFVTLRRTTLSQSLVRDLSSALDECEARGSMLVLEGGEEAFCLGADFEDYANAPIPREVSSEGADATPTRAPEPTDPDALYTLWLRLATGPVLTLAHVRGRVNAGGVGLVSACDLVLANGTAEFSLSEMLFGLFPACVFPFLMRRVGHQRAHAMTLTTLPVSVDQAASWGLVDAWEKDSAALLRKTLLRLRRLSPAAIARYKAYARAMGDTLQSARLPAVTANRAMFADPATRAGLQRYAQKGLFPWESD